MNYPVRHTSQGRVGSNQSTKRELTKENLYNLDFDNYY